MATLADPNACAALRDRIAKLDPNADRKWGRMSAHQMICHLSDSFRVATGDKYASPDTNLFKRSVVKWVALHTSLPWPHGVATRPELLHDHGGTPPSDWTRDRTELEELIPAFAARQKYGFHPIFGEMNKSDWLIWAYRHIDHHLRQFGA